MGGVVNRVGSRGEITGSDLWANFRRGVRRWAYIGGGSCHVWASGIGLVGWWTYGRYSIIFFFR
jgi:hypothetical protein